MTKNAGLARPVLACLFAALISVGAYIAIPLPGTPVPVVLQNFFIMVAALALGPRWALVSTLLYLALGAAGLPVFSGGTGGFARFLGPTGGYLLGYIPSVLAIGLVSRAGRPSRWKDALALVLGSLIVFAAGVARLKSATGGTWAAAVAAGLLPFIPGDAIKIAAAASIAAGLRARIEEALGPESGQRGSGDVGRGPEDLM